MVWKGIAIPGIWIGAGIACREEPLVMLIVAPLAALATIMVAVCDRI